MAQLDTSIPPKLIKVRRLAADDVADYRKLRLEGLKNHPEAFSSSWEDESGKPHSWWIERLEANTLFGGWIDDSPLLGVAGLRVHDAVKLRHKGMLWGMYVRARERTGGVFGAAGDRAGPDSRRGNQPDGCGFKHRRPSPLQRCRLRTIRAGAPGSEDRRCVL
jgi:hypothetical protein